MTEEDAITIIKNIEGIIRQEQSWSYESKQAVYEAFNMAIKALEGGD